MKASLCGFCMRGADFRWVDRCSQKSCCPRCLSFPKVHCQISGRPTGPDSNLVESMVEATICDHLRSWGSSRGSNNVPHNGSSSFSTQDLASLRDSHTQSSWSSPAGQNKRKWVAGKMVFINLRKLLANARSEKASGCECHIKCFECSYSERKRHPYGQQPISCGDPPKLPHCCARSREPPLSLAQLKSIGSLTSSPASSHHLLPFGPPSITTPFQPAAPPSFLSRIVSLSTPQLYILDNHLRAGIVLF